jgi:PAS domain S-box-containing protein
MNKPNNFLSSKEKKKIKEAFSNSKVNNRKIIKLFEEIFQKKFSSLEETSRKYKILLENSNDLIIIINENFKFEYINQSVHYEKLGYTFSELIGTSVLDIIHPEDKKKILEASKKGFENGKFNSKVRIKHCEGKYLWVEVRGTSFRDPGGREKAIVVSKDISDQKEISLKLRKSEKKYKNLVENLFNVAMIINLKGDILYVSPQIKSIFGYKESDLIGKKIFEYIHPEDLPYVLEQFKELLTQKKLLSAEYRAKSKQGQYLWVQSKGKVIDFADEKVIIGTMRNINEKKIAQDKLRESKRRLRLFIDSSPDMFFLKNKNLKYLLVNKVNAEFFGKKEKDIIGKTDFDFMNERSAKKCRETDLKAINKRDMVIDIEEVNKKIYETRKMPIFKNERVVGVGGIIRDITKRKEMEIKLKESEEKYREIAELLPDIIYEADKDGKLSYINPIAYQKFGYNESDLEDGIHIFDLISEDYLKKAKEQFNKILSGQITKPHEYLMVKEDGTKFYARVHSRPIIKEDQILGVRGTVSDINEMILAQNKIEESEKKLKKLNRLKSDLLRRTSHELKTPLVSIKGFTNLLLDQYSDKLDHKVLEIINEIQKGCNRLENLVFDILNTAQLESGKIKILEEEINISQIIKKAANSLNVIAKSRDQSLILKIDENIFAIGHPEKFREVIENLLLNAIKYSPSKETIEVNSKKSKQNIIISIKDNGIGFTKEEKKNLFTQFGKIERYGEGYDLDIDGSGLGLYISKKIIELHGGEIWMKSEGRNKGSIFYFSIPRSK